MGMMNRRDVLRLGVPLASAAKELSASACQSALEERTVAEYNSYVKTAREAIEQAISGKLSRVPEEHRAAATRKLESDRWFVWNLQDSKPNGALRVYKGVVVDWMGALLLPGVSLEKFEGVLQNYAAYKRVYQPYIYDCYATQIPGPGYKNFRVTSILHDVLEKPAPLVPDQHFSFEVVADSNYFQIGEEKRTLVIRTHANQIREADGGRPEFADGRKENRLLPAGRGQGVLWKSDTWWRATQIGSALYAEYESVSLARGLDAVEFFSLCSVLKLPGVKGKALESMVTRPRKTVTSVMLSTKKALESD